MNGTLIVDAGPRGARLIAREGEREIVVNLSADATFALVRLLMSGLMSSPATGVRP